VEDAQKINSDMPNLVIVPVGHVSTSLQRIDACLQSCPPGYIAIVPPGFPIGDMWLEDSLFALINSRNDSEVFELEGSTTELWAIVAKKKHIQLARQSFPDLPIRDALENSGIEIRRIVPDEIPFKFDSLYKEAKRYEDQLDYHQAAEIYEFIAANYGNKLWMISLAANAYYLGGDLQKAGELTEWINQRRPIVDTLLLQAQTQSRQGNIENAARLLEASKFILENSSDMQLKIFSDTHSK